MMSDNQPREYDVVLGGGSQAPVDGVVLGGIEGVKRRWESGNIQQKIVALSDALNYGDIGLDFVIQALHNESKQIKCAAYSLLQDRKEPKIKALIQECNPWQKITCLHTLEGHSASVRSVAISADSKTIVSGSEDGNIIVWDLQTGKIKRVINSYLIRSIAISPDGKTIISRGGDYDNHSNRIELWNMQSGKLETSLDETSVYVFSIAVTPDGNHLITGSESSSINIWNLETKQVQKTIAGHRYLAHALDISADGKTIVSGSQDKSVKVWNLQSGKQIHSFKGYKNGHKSAIKSLAISPNGNTIVSGSDDKTVKIWNLQTKKLEHSLEEHKGWIYSVAISPYGQSVISAGRDREIRIWDLQTGKMQRILGGHLDWIFSVAISPDGKTLVSGSRDKTVKIWGLK